MAEQSLVLYIATENNTPEINVERDCCSTDMSLSRIDC